MNTLRSFKALVLAVSFVSLASFANAQSSGRWIGRIQVTPSSSGQSLASQNDVRQDADVVSRGPDTAGGVEITEKKPTIVGSWLLTIKVPDNPPPFDSFSGFWALTQDGILIASAQGDVSPAPLPSVTSQYGAWSQTGSRQFAATFKAVFYDFATGDNLGMLKVRQTMTLSETGDEWSGPFKLTVYDPNGNVVANGGGTVQATRIKVEALD